MKKDRELAIPGDELVKSMDYLPGKNCFREGESIITKRLGLVSVDGRVISIIPLSGVYLPKYGDMVIGTVAEIQSSGWIVDINSLHQAYLPLSGVKEFIDTKRTDLSKVYAIGDVIYSKISLVNGDSVHLSMQDTRSRKFTSGRVIKMSSAKVPRLIGKQGSMIRLIKDSTGCRINVGQNGAVWIEGANDNTVLSAVQLIEKNSHIDGLTDKVSEFLGKTKLEKPVEKIVERPNEVQEKEPTKEIKEAEPVLTKGVEHEKRK